MRPQITCPDCGAVRIDAWDMSRVSLVVVVLWGVIGCGNQSQEVEPSKPDQQSAFLVVVPDGSQYRITPDLLKLQELGSFVLSPPSGVPLEREFQRVVTERVLSQTERGGEVDVDDVVFAEIRERDESGQCLSPIEFRIGDYALVEKVK